MIGIIAASAVMGMGSWQQWLLLATAFGLVLAPWLLGFTENEAAAWDHWMAAVVLGVTAATATLAPISTDPRDASSTN